MNDLDSIICCEACSFPMFNSPMRREIKRKGGTILCMFCLEKRVEEARQKLKDPVIRAKYREMATQNQRIF